MNVYNPKLGSWSRKILIAITLLGLWAIFPKESNALKKLPASLQIGTELGEVVFPPTCTRDMRIIANVRATGFMVPGTQVNLEALNPRYIADQPYLTGGCQTSVSPFNDPFTWTITSKPQGSNVVLQDDDSFTPFFTPDIGGEYTITFTACPNGCEFVFETGPRIIAGPARYNVVVNISDEAVIPPATEPIDPVGPITARTAFNNTCSGGLVDPQWLTAERWSGPQDYRLLEGKVRWSHISRVDQGLNHHTQDFLFGVRPDPSFNYLMTQGANRSGNVEVEWERRSFPEVFRPTRGDRVSVIGYWIRDCGHEPNNTEIHPPVLVATHRARPVKLDGYGSDVVVPGIITDLWANTDAGETTGNCSQTGLHNPIDINNPLVSRCLPSSQGFSKNPINRNMRFRIYLPKNPRDIYAEAGLSIPPQVPLFTKISNPNSSGGPDPQITPHIADGYLEVNVDLSSYSGNDYSRKIEAAWALPSPSNWDMKAWRVQIQTLDVHNDSDGITAGDGDWRFWANLNNSEKEWVKMYDCDGCVHGRINYGNNPWTTGSEGSRSLGPDVLLFPNQYIWLHTSGFDDDTFWSDYTGEINDLRLQQSQVRSTLSHCNDSGNSNCGEYTLTYEISPGSSPASPVLNASGQALFDSYKLTRRSVFEIAYPEMVMKFWNHPVSDWVGDDSTAVTADNEYYFEGQDEEPFGAFNISNEAFAQQLLELEKTDSTAFGVLLKELQEEFDNALRKGNKEDVFQALEAVKVAMPKQIWKKHFDYIKLPSNTWIKGVSNALVLTIGAFLFILIIFYIWKKAQRET